MGSEVVFYTLVTALAITVVMVSFHLSRNSRGATNTRLLAIILGILAHLGVLGTYVIAAALNFDGSCRAILVSPYPCSALDNMLLVGRFVLYGSAPWLIAFIVLALGAEFMGRRCRDQ